MSDIFDLASEPQEVQKELFELIIKAARRATYDLRHASDCINDLSMRERMQKRADMWLTIFNPAQGPKDYRTDMHVDLAMLEARLERAVALLDEAGVSHNFDCQFMR